jgi:hypothetical protein
LTKDRKLPKPKEIAPGLWLRATIHGLRQKSIGNARMVDESCASIVGTLRKCDEYACKGRLLAKPN